MNAHAMVTWELSMLRKDMAGYGDYPPPPPNPEDPRPPAYPID